MKLFFIPKGTLLFRTSTELNTIPNKPTFYALELDDAKLYLGSDHYEKGKRLNIIKVTKNIYLIDMRYISVLKRILNGFKIHRAENEMNEILIKSIEGSFFSGINEETTDEIIRHSDYARDRIYTDALCLHLKEITEYLDIKSDNVVGYIFPKTKNYSGENFHSEIIICNPPLCLELSQLNIQRNIDIINRNSLDKISKQKLRIIPNQLQNQIEKMEYSNVTSKEFKSIYEHSLQIRTEIVSKSSAFSIILKSIYIDTINTKKWSVIKKIPKYKYTENCIEFAKKHEKCPDEIKYSKFLMDSLIIEFLNGLFINKLIEESKDVLLKVIFVTTYCLLFVDIHDFYKTQNKYRTRQYNFLKQMQTTNNIKYSYFDLQSLNMSKILLDKDKDLKYIYEKPTLLCKNYEESLMPILYQQDANTNISVYTYMKMEKIFKKDKLIELIKITYMIYKALYTINIESPFTHNDLHLNNVLLDNSFRLFDDVVTNVLIPRIIDYGRGSTVYSDRYFRILESRQGDSYIDYCNRSRTFRFKNNFTISMDLLFIYQIYLNREEIDTITSNREIMNIKYDFFKILEELPQGEYFEYNQKNQIRLSYEEWINIMKGKFKLKGIKSIGDIFGEIRNLITKYQSIFNPKP